MPSEIIHTSFPPIELHIKIDIIFYNPNPMPPFLRMGRHCNLFLRRDSILGPPQTGDCLPLRVKVDSALSVKVARATARDRGLVAGKAEHGQRDGDGDVDTLLAGLDLFLEAGRGRAGAGEDGCAVAVLVCVDQVDGVVEGGDVEADEDGAEDLFGVAFHVGFDVCNHRWADLGGYCQL